MERRSSQQEPYVVSWQDPLEVLRPLEPVLVIRVYPDAGVPGRLRLLVLERGKLALHLRQPTAELFAPGRGDFVG